MRFCRYRVFLTGRLGTQWDKGRGGLGNQVHLLKFKPLCILREIVLLINNVVKIGSTVADGFY